MRILWKHFSPRKHSPLCTNMLVGKHHYSKGWHDQYGPGYIYNKAIQITDRASVDKAIDHVPLVDVASLSPRKVAALTSNPEKFIDLLASLRHRQIKPLAKKLAAHVDDQCLSRVSDAISCSPRLHIVLVAFELFHEINKINQIDLDPLASSLIDLSRLLCPDMDMLQSDKEAYVGVKCIALLNDRARQVYLTPIVRRLGSLQSRSIVRIVNTSDSLAALAAQTMKEHVTSLSEEALFYINCSAKPVNDLVRMRPFIGRARQPMRKMLLEALGTKNTRLALTDRTIGRILTSLDQYAILAQPLAHGSFTLGCLRELAGSDDPEILLSLLTETSHKRLLQTIHGTGHPTEVALLKFAIEARHPLRAFYALSCLSALFMNTRGKQDRHAMLRFIDQALRAFASYKRDNHAICWFPFDVNPEFLIGVEDIIHWEQIPTLLLACKHSRCQDTEVRDTFLMLHDLTRTNQNVVENERQTGLVNRWIEKNGLADIKKFHDYLDAKEKRDRGGQKRWSANYEINFPLPADVASLDNAKFVADDKEFVISIPRHGLDLREIGSAQHHCIGSQSYVNACVTGSSFVLLIKPARTYLTKHGDVREPNKKEVRAAINQGYSFHVRQDGRILQAKGDRNTDPPEAVFTAVRNILTIHLTSQKV